MNNSLAGRPEFRVTVIGGGVIGLCTAYFLHKAGYEVQVIEQDGPHATSGCSYGNAGMIVPSHFVPLAAPGVIRQGLKWLLNSKSPLYIKPRLDRDLLQWLWLFFRSANKKNVLRVGDQLFRLNQASRDLYASIIEEEDLNVSYGRRGLMMLYQTERVQAEEEHLAEEARRLGIKADVLSTQEVQSLESDFEMHIRGGVHYYSDAHLDPGIFMNELRKYLEKVGVRMHFKVRCRGFRSSGSRLTHVQTYTGDVKTDVVVMASGAWSQELCKKLGIHIPLQGGKGYSFTIEDPPLKLKTPSILCERKVALTPMGNNLRVAGTMEIAGTNRGVSLPRLQGIKEGVSKYLRNFEPGWFENIEPWTGLRPVSPDGMPYIGKSKSWDNLYINTGHAMMGMSLAPVSGKLLSDLIQGNEVDYNTDLLSPDRF